LSTSITLNGICSFTLKIKALKKSIGIIGIFTILIAANIFAQGVKSVPADFCITTNDKQLSEALNEFLTENGREPVNLSKSLSYVAFLHVNDLIKNHPDTSICNLSSWSRHGDWTACCYNKYVPDQECMWGKPKELTPFRYRGYELALFLEEGAHPDTVMQVLMSSNKAIDMLLAKGAYSKKKWISIGVSVKQNYASIWFAQREDKTGAPKICQEITDNKESSRPTVSVYYVIAGSFEAKADAKEMLKRLKQNGFKKAGILKSGINTRVYFQEFTNLKEAMHFKQNLPYTYGDAWIFKK
jgi:hypothetical protein